MDTSEFDNRIATVNEQISSLKADMEDLCGNYLRGAATYFSDFAERHVKEAVTLAPDKASELGKPGVKRVKKHLEKLRESMTDLVEQHLNQQRCWSHRYKDSAVDMSSGYPRRSNLGYPALHNGERAIASKVGNLLAEHDLLAGVSSYWKRDYSRGLEYQHGVGSSDEMKTAMEQYRSLDEELTKRRRDLMKFQTEKSQAQAADLWESA